MANIKYYNVKDRLSVDDMIKAFGNNPLGMIVVFCGFVSVLAIDNARKYISSYNVRYLGDTDKRISVKETNYKDKTLRLQVVKRNE